MASALTAALFASLVVVGDQGARADHNTDIHSDNMSLVATLDTGHGGDLAFWGDTAVLSHGSADGDPGGRNDGFQLVDISDPTKPTNIGGVFECVKTGADVSVWRDLVFLSSSENVLTSDDCHGESLGDPEGFMGLQIVSIENPEAPERIASVNTCPDRRDPTRCSDSHTHTLVPDLEHRDPATGKRDPRLIVYVNRTNQAVVEVPLRNPVDARVINWVDFAPPSSGFAGACHDVSVFLPRNLAACAGEKSTQVQIWDISDPADPSLVSVTSNPEMDNVHGSTFSWDGNILVVADEALAGLASSGPCPGPATSSPIGALWFYDISDPAVPVLKNFYQLPQPVEAGGCTAHQFNVVPLRSGRDVLVAGWFLGGTTVVDFTDPDNPEQIAHYRAEPDDPERRSNPWSSYWYNGFVYANNTFDGDFTPKTERGFDVFAVDDPRLKDHIRLNRFNFGTQECLPPPHGAAHGNLTTCETDDGGGLLDAVRARGDES
ncbi:MAG: hypothetical protein KY469_18895 [Actinobacteria bacterium]|nr:hypothetical protein [Actinomycetota bacterium]